MIDIQLYHMLKIVALGLRMVYKQQKWMNGMAHNSLATKKNMNGETGLGETIINPLNFSLDLNPCS